MVNLVVEVAQGKLRGKSALDYKGNIYYSFQGIPYAKPPVGERRFKAPERPGRWDGIRDATKEGSECLSRHMLSKVPVGSEDCLFLNVFTAQLPAGGPPTPVMMWIHGGGFICGSSRTELFGPDYLVTGDVVLVTLNYRIGLLGFLSLKDPALAVPGNAGLKDMVLALKWIQENIAKFNGDPGNVTVFGESAGASAAHLLMLSPLAKGLFHKLIAQSGCCLNPWTYGERGIERLSEILGLDTVDEGAVLKHLNSFPENRFLEVQDKIKQPIQPDESQVAAFVVEDDVPGAFMTEHPLDVLRNGNYHKIPVVLGYSDMECILLELLYKDAYGGMRLVTDFERKIPENLNVKKGTALSKEIADKIKRFYYDESEPNAGNKDKYYTMHTDIFFFRGIYRSVKLHLGASPEPLYFYRFSADTRLNIFKAFAAVDTKGACHSDINAYLFKTAYTPALAPDGPEDALIRALVRLWTGFARTGAPDPETAVWRPVTHGSYHCLEIGRTLACAINTDARRMDFWDDIAAMGAVRSRW